MDTRRSSYPEGGVGNEIDGPGMSFPHVLTLFGNVMYNYYVDPQFEYHSRNVTLSDQRERRVPRAVRHRTNCWQNAKQRFRFSNQPCLCPTIRGILQSLRSFRTTLLLVIIFPNRVCLKRESTRFSSLYLPGYSARRVHYSSALWVSLPSRWGLSDSLFAGSRRMSLTHP